MATWTDIPNASLEPGAPARSADAIALRDNVTALAEGASGAPPFRAPINPILAGTTYVIKNVELSESITGSIAVQMGAEYIATTSGVVTVTLEHRMEICVGVNVYARVYKNGAVVHTFSTTNCTYTAQSVDISIAIGDRIKVDHYSSTALSDRRSFCRNVKLNSSTQHVFAFLNSGLST